MANKEERKQLIIHATDQYVKAARVLGDTQRKHLREKVEESCATIDKIVEKQIKSMRESAEQACVEIDAQDE
jgi:hypothetical protein